ncbi:hypothetical protein jhhlp_003898, partial [Lomentospora prolificans]
LTDLDKGPEPASSSTNDQTSTIISPKTSHKHLQQLVFWRQPLSRPPNLSLSPRNPMRPFSRFPWIPKMPSLPGSSSSRALALAAFPSMRLTFALLPGSASVDLDECISRLYKKELLAESVIEAICAKTKELLMRESNVIHVQAPITVVGDIHGQFYDLIEIFKIGGYCPDTNYLFLGDYVDRGMFSVETISLLVCLKLRYPNRVHLIRGNHESRGVTQSYGFYTECSRKYGNANVWHYFTDMFDFLTLSVVINDQIFCVHGGLSPSIHSIDQIKIIDRFREIPHEGPMADLVWSDPDPDRDEFSLSPRGAGYTFGAQVVKKFLTVNNMTHILRAHQLCQEGYQVLYDDQLSTVWSAPNYCYRCGNMASVLEVSDTGERFFNVFAAAPENDLHKDLYLGGDKSADGNALPDYFL